MRYLKKFNERLVSDTYMKTASELKRLGHLSRATDLEEWATTSKEREKGKERKKIIDMYSKHGVWSIDIDERFTGNFYITMDFCTGINGDNWNYFQEEDRFNSASLWMTLVIGLIPADEETYLKSLEKLDMEGDIYWAENIGIKMSDSCEMESKYESGEWQLELRNTKNMFYMHGDEYKIWFRNRIQANKFRKLIIDIFEGNVTMGETNEWPGGIKEQIIDFYCNKKGLSIEEFDKIVDSIKEIKVNKIPYRD